MQGEGAAPVRGRCGQPECGPPTSGRCTGSRRFSPGPARIPTKFTPENSCLINTVFVNFLEKGVLVSTRRVLGDSGKKARARLWSPRGTWRPGLCLSHPVRLTSPACSPAPGRRGVSGWVGAQGRAAGGFGGHGGPPEDRSPLPPLEWVASFPQCPSHGLLRPRRPGREHLSPCHKRTVLGQTPSPAGSKSPEFLLFSRLPQAL